MPSNNLLLRLGKILARPVGGTAAESAVGVPIQRLGRARIFPKSSRASPNDRSSEAGMS